jgi:hypothetical protein
MFRFFLFDKRQMSVRIFGVFFCYIRCFVLCCYKIIRLCDKIALNRLKMPLLLTFKQK